MSEIHGLCTVLPFRLKITDRHRRYLARWLEAGRCMGLHDAEISYWTPSEQPNDAGYVLVWVRENADPAYLVVPEGGKWTVVDHLRQTKLGRFHSFEAALHLIRPVLPLKVVAA